MKLYTEEEIVSFLKKEFADEIDAETFMENLTPIELPDSIEIHRKIHELKINDINQRNAFYLGSLFVIDKIKKN